MTVTAIRLVVVVALVAASLGIVHLVPSVHEATRPPRLHALPWLLGPWTAVEGAPLEALPADPSETLSVRRTYARGDQSVWVSVSAFTRQDVPERRASLNTIYPRRHTVQLEQLALPLSLNGSPKSAARLPVVVVTTQEQRLLVVYWRQLGPSVYGDDYRYRLDLMWSTLMAREANMVLVRMAMPLPRTGSLDGALGTMSSLAPALHAGIGQLLGP